MSKPKAAKAVKKETVIKPQHVRDGVWFYPDRKGLDFVVESRVNGALVSGEQFTLTWRQIERALKLRESVTPAQRTR